MHLCRISIKLIKSNLEIAQKNKNKDCSKKSWKRLMRIREMSPQRHRAI